MKLRTYLTASNVRADGASLATSARIVTPNSERLVRVVVCLFVGLSAAAHAEQPKNPQIRPLDPSLSMVVEAGRYYSSTFRALVDRLEEGNFVVYVQYGELQGGIQGRLVFLSAVGEHRYVLVELARELDTARQMAIVGYELQHAIEVLEQPGIVDHATFANAFSRAGFKRRHFADGGIGIDTAAAVVIGRQIWREVSGSMVALATR